MQTRRLLAPVAAAALAVTAIFGAGVANADEATSGSAVLGSLDLGSLGTGSADLQIPGVPNLSVSVDYKCVTTGTAEDLRSSAHILTTVTNTGLGAANNVATFTTVPGGAAAAQHAVSIAAGESITYDLDTKSDNLVATPVFALTYASSLDTNPFDNVAVSFAPAVCA